MTRFASLVLIRSGLALLALAGCRVDTPGADSAVVEPGDTLVASNSESIPDVAPAPDAACMLVAQDSVALYTRPSVAAPRFGTLAPGDSVRASGRAAGFVGIDPGTAQAATVGALRLRYAASDGPFALRGDCAALPEGPRLDPVACYQMAQAAVRLHARPDTSSAVVATMPAQSLAEATAKTPTGWLRVRLGANGPPGWVGPSDVNVSGAMCDAL